MGLIITLLLTGLVLLFVELFLVSGIGVAGFLGIAAFVWASVHAFNTLGPTEGSIVTAISIVIVAACTAYALRSKTWRRFELGSDIGNTADIRKTYKTACVIKCIYTSETFN